MTLPLFTMKIMLALAVPWALLAIPLFKLLKAIGLWKPKQIDFKVSMKDKVVIVTGCNTGLGKRTAANIAKMGGTVVMACRSVDKANQAKADIDQELAQACSSSSFPHSRHGKLVVLPLDLGDFASIRSFVGQFKKEYQRLDVLVCNAGLSGLKGKTTEGFNLTLGTNYMGHFYLIKLLKDTLIASGPSRVVCLSSVMHHWGSSDIEEVLTGVYKSSKRYQGNTYNDSKLSMALLAYHLQNHIFRGTDVVALAANPGAVESDIWRNMDSFTRKWILDPAMSAVFLTVDQGSSTSVYAATYPLQPQDLAQGYFYYQPYLAPLGKSLLLPFELCGPYVGWSAARPTLPANPDKASQKLWDMSEKLVAGIEKKNDWTSTVEEQEGGGSISVNAVKQ